MLDAGVKFLLKGGGNADFRVLESPSVYGIEGAMAQELDRVVCEAGGPDITGAMHHTVMARLAFINKNGWDRYCAELRERHAKEKAGAPTA